MTRARRSAIPHRPGRNGPATLSVPHAESAKRVASAVGEDTMVVMLVHRYLEKL
jgi:hypothetical protein